MPDFDELHGNINLYRKNGVRGLFIQGMGEPGGGAESMALRGYVVSKLLWQPDQPVWPLVDEPLANFQIGLPSSWIMPDNSDNKDTPLAPEGTLARKWKERGPTCSFSART